MHEFLPVPLVLLLGTMEQSLVHLLSTPLYIFIHIDEVHLGFRDVQGAGANPEAGEGMELAGLQWLCVCCSEPRAAPVTGWWGWKGPLEITWTNPPTKTGSPGASDTGTCPGWVLNVLSMQKLAEDVLKFVWFLLCLRHTPFLRGGVPARRDVPGSCLHHDPPTSLC